MNCIPKKILIKINNYLGEIEYNSNNLTRFEFALDVKHVSFEFLPVKYKYNLLL